MEIHLRRERGGMKEIPTPPFSLNILLIFNPLFTLKWLPQCISQSLHSGTINNRLKTSKYIFTYFFWEAVSVDLTQFPIFYMFRLWSHKFCFFLSYHVTNSIYIERWLIKKVKQMSPLNSNIPHWLFHLF